MVTKARLDDLHIPVAEVVPHKPVQRHGCIVHAVLVKRTGHLGPCLGQARQDPTILHRQGGFALRGHGIKTLASQIQQHKTRCVPDLVAEAIALFEAVRRQLHILTFLGQQHEAVAHRIRTVLLDHLDRVDAIARRLAHAAAFAVEHCRVHIADIKSATLLPRHLIDELVARHDHARDPQVDDLARRREELRRIETHEIFGRIRPSERGERPQPA